MFIVDGIASVIVVIVALMVTVVSIIEILIVIQAASQYRRAPSKS